MPADNNNVLSEHINAPANYDNVSADNSELENSNVRAHSNARTDKNISVIVTMATR